MNSYDLYSIQHFIRQQPESADPLSDLTEYAMFGDGSEASCESAQIDPQQTHPQSFAPQFPLSFNENLDPSLCQISPEFEDNEEQDVEGVMPGRLRDAVSKNNPNTSSSSPAKNSASSKLAVKRAECASKYGVSRVKADGEPKGRVRRNPVTGALEWWDAFHDKFILASYHDTFREEFILLDKEQHRPYKNAPAKGFDALDITSNCDYLDQHLWEFDSPHALKYIRDSEGNKVMCLQERPNRKEWVSNLKPWYYAGYLILDHDNNPVADTPWLPRCLSSRLEGGRMEAFQRVFPWLQRSDIRARMPGIVDGRPLSNPSTFGQRQSRFRNCHNLIAWNVRKGTVEKRKALGYLCKASSASNTAAISPLGFPLRGVKRNYRETLTPSSDDEESDNQKDHEKDLGLHILKRHRPNQELSIQSLAQVHHSASTKNRNSPGSGSHFQSDFFEGSHIITEDDYLPQR